MLYVPFVSVYVQVPGCNADLAAEPKAYFLHRHICREHMQVTSDPPLSLPDYAHPSDIVSSSRCDSDNPWPP